MSDSGQGIGTPPRACPFVALEDDRDRRANAPDPRHRCYAVATPQPRALAHQEAYCLSSAFPSCTFFLDWAARAAANPVQAGFPAAATVAAPGPGPGADEALDPVGRPWATPPPWVGQPELKTTRPSLRPNEQIGAFPDPADHAFDHDLGVPDPPRPPSTPQPAYQAPPLPAAPDVQVDYRPPFNEAPSAYAPQQVSSWSKPAGPVDAGYAAAPQLPSDDALAGGFTGGPVDAAAIATPVLPSDDALAGRLTGRPIDAGPPPRIDLQARPNSAKGRDGSSDWARPKRFEAYPTLGRRIRLRGISPVLLGLFALMIAALVLFLLPGFLSGRGGAANPSAKPSIVATLGAPTPTPGPTPQSYTVKRGDALSAIARSFGLTVEQMVCFNGIKNPNVLTPGQVLLIPPSDYTCPHKGGGGTPKASGTPTVSASPHQ
jgi:nucleoid-associated protein YgaU